MKTFLNVVQIILSILFIVSILFQSRGQGMSGSFGGGGEFYRSRKGVEKILLKATVLLAVLFLASSIANILVK